jgi:predicted AAA+ superfamily ATPase
MLGGRAFLYKLYPLTHLELGQDFDLDQVLNFGSLAKVFEFSPTREKNSFLRSYVETYLKEEILIEQLIRSLPPFLKFLEIAAVNDTEIVNFANVGRDVRTDPKNISNYYAILEDTLLGFFLEPFHTSIRKRQSKAPKFYLFDTGVKRALAGTLDVPAVSKSFEYGTLFESFIVNEIYRLLTYSEKSFKLSFIRVEDREIDLVIERGGEPTYLLEIKSTAQAHEHQTSALHHYSSLIQGSVPLLLSLDPVRKKFGPVSCLPWKEGISALGIVMPE